MLGDTGGCISGVFGKSGFGRGNIFWWVGHLLVLLFATAFLLFAFTSPKDTRSFSSLKIGRETRERVGCLGVKSVMDKADTAQFSPGGRIAEKRTTTVVKQTLRCDSKGDSAGFGSISSDCFTSKCVGSTCGGKVLSNCPSNAFEPGGSMAENRVTLVLGQTFGLNKSGADSSKAILVGLKVTRKCPSKAFNLGGALVQSSFTIFLTESVGRRLEAEETSISFSGGTLIGTSMLGIEDNPSVGCPIIGGLRAKARMGVNCSVKG